MSTITNPLSGLIEGLLQGHEIATHLHRQAQEDQAFRTNQALHEQQMSMQDIMNAQRMQEIARPVVNGTVQDRMNGMLTPTSSGDPGAADGETPDISNLPVKPGPSLPGPQIDYARKADSKRLVSSTDRFGNKTQYELKTPQEQQQDALNLQISGNSALEKAKLQAQADAQQSVLENQRKLRGIPVPADLAASYPAAQYPNGLTKEEIDQARANLAATQEHQGKVATEAATARKTGLEADELQRQLDLRKGAKPSDYLNLVDQVVPPGVKGNASLNMRTKAVVNAAIGRGDFKAAEEAIKEAGAEMGRVEVATNPLVAQNKINIQVAGMDAKNAGMGVTEDDFQREGEKYARTGIMPSLGMQANGRGKIIHYANEWARQNGFKPADLVTMQAAYSGDKASLASFQKQRDQIVSFEQTATKNLDQFIGLASKVVDTGSPWLNMPMRNLSEKLVGSEAMAAVNAARQIATNEVAKVTSGGGLGAVLSDSARKEVEAYNPKDATLKQTLAVAKVLKQDMANRHQSMDATLGDIKTRIGGTAAPPAPGIGKISVTAPDGSVHPFDTQQQADAFKKLAGIK